MTDRIRIVIALSRPPVLILLGLFAAVGLAQGGVIDDPVALGRVFVVVAAFLISSVAVNDLADEAIDRVNLPDDASRPLVTGAGSRQELPVIAAVAGVVALTAAATINGRALLVVVGGFVLSLGYSLRPVRLADRGALASLLLPAGYVAVPFLTGLTLARADVHGTDLALLGGLYLGFIGRILLKDFRDVRGDALFGKRTFLVRYGRRTTCATSAACWVLGSAALLGIGDRSLVLLGAQLVWVVVALVLLRALADDGGARRDEALISAIAVVGRGMLLTLIAHLGMTNAGWSAIGAAATLVAIVVISLGQAHTMARTGPVSRLRLPPDLWSAAEQQEGDDRAGHDQQQDQAGHPHAGAAEGCVVVAHGVRPTPALTAGTDSAAATRPAPGG